MRSILPALIPIFLLDAGLLGWRVTYVLRRRHTSPVRAEAGR